MVVAYITPPSTSCDRKQACRLCRVLPGRESHLGHSPVGRVYSLRVVRCPPGLGRSETGSLHFLLPHPHPNSFLSCWEMAFQLIPEKQAGGAVVYLRSCSWEKPRSLCQKHDSLSIKCPGGMQIKLARGSNSRLGAFLRMSCSTWLLADSGICSQRLFRIHLKGATCLSCIVAGLCLLYTLFHIVAVEETQRRLCEPRPLVPAQTGQ